MNEMLAATATTDPRPKGRALSQPALAALRALATHRISQGEPPSNVAVSLGMSRAWAYQCYAALRKDGANELRAGPGGGRPCKLSAAQQRQVLACLDGKRPDQCGLRGSLWTQGLVRDLIHARLGVKISLLTVAALLSRIGLTPPKPLQSVATIHPEVAASWRRSTLPVLVERAKAKGAELLFGETLECPSGSGRQFWTVNAQGAFWFWNCPDLVDDPLWKALANKMMRGRNRPVCLVLSTNRLQPSDTVRQQLQTTHKRLTLHTLGDMAVAQPAAQWRTWRATNQVVGHAHPSC